MTLTPGAGSITQIRSPADSLERKIARLAFLAPSIQLAILEGRQPVGLTLARLSAMVIPQTWIDQRQALGFTESDHGTLVHRAVRQIPEA